MASRITLGNLTIDRRRYETSVGGQRVKLTYVEFELLFRLAHNAGKVLALERLVEVVWGAGVTGGDRKLRVHICRLRKKISGSHPWQISTITKRGYALTDAERAPRLFAGRVRGAAATPRGLAGQAWS
jgi:DNA-binding response OmpR family regulator